LLDGAWNLRVATAGTASLIDQFSKLPVEVMRSAMPDARMLELGA
jgi:hypothetical protein